MYTSFIIFYFWLMLNAIAFSLILISKNRIDYLIEITAFFYGKDILEFILKVIILFAYLPFTIASLIKEILTNK